MDPEYSEEDLTKPNKEAKNNNEQYPVRSSLTPCAASGAFEYEEGTNEVSHFNTEKAEIIKNSATDSQIPESDTTSIITPSVTADDQSEIDEEAALAKQRKNQKKKLRKKNKKEQS